MGAAVHAGFEIIVFSRRSRYRCRYPDQLMKEQALASHYFALFATLSMSLILGCTDASNEVASDPNVVDIDESDAEMEAAISKAKETFGFFVNNWETMRNDGYSLKFAMPTADGELEYIWFSPTKIHDGRITGECANDPVKIPALKLATPELLPSRTYPIG